jgi:hypothetical protein
MQIRIILFALLLIIFNNNLIYCSPQDDFIHARERLADAKVKDDFDLIISSTNHLIKCSEKIKKYDIVAWQYNNLSYYYIQEFCDRTGYEYNVKKCKEIKKINEKNKFINKLKIEYAKEIKLLNVAKKYIEMADKLNKQYPDKDRTVIIGSNMVFIDKTIKFIEGEK